MERWLRVGAAVSGFVGFAIGRTIWHDPLAEWVEGSASRDDAAVRIGRTYLRMVEVYQGAR